MAILLRFRQFLGAAASRGRRLRLSTTPRSQQTAYSSSGTRNPELPKGASLVIVSATIGATVIFLAAKTALASFFKAHMGATARKMEEGVRRNAFFYVLFTRLVPVFPFFAVNIAAGLLGVAARTYVAATFLGMIPGVIVYAGLGSGLGRLF